MYSLDIVGTEVVHVSVVNSEAKVLGVFVERHDFVLRHFVHGVVQRSRHQAGPISGLGCFLEYNLVVVIYDA